MLEGLRERMRALREGLEALGDDRREEDGAGARRPGPRRRAPVHAPADRPLPRPSEPPPVALGPVEEAAAPRPPRPLRARIRDPRRLREAFVLREILDRPLGVRRPRRRGLHDR